MPCIISSLHQEENQIASKMTLGFPGGSDAKESACNAVDLGSIPGLGRFSGEEWNEWKKSGNPLYYSRLRIPWTEAPTVHRVTKSWAWLEWLTLSLFKMALGCKLNMLVNTHLIQLTKKTQMLNAGCILNLPSPEESLHGYVSFPMS